MHINWARGSLVTASNTLRVGRYEFELRWVRNYSLLHTPSSGAHEAPRTMDAGCFSQESGGRGVALENHPHYRPG